MSFPAGNQKQFLPNSGSHERLRPSAKRKRFAVVTRGFTGRQSTDDRSDRIPPGQHLVENFPVLSAGPTPHVEQGSWKFALKIGPRPVKSWTWAEFNSLPQTKMLRDIHCVTSWSKLNTAWEGVLVDDILADAWIEAPTDFTCLSPIWPSPKQWAQ
jgi:DMSO/TMAO reductase YedYZ molybdopterin-dependent catalytic subunit